MKLELALRYLPQEKLAASAWYLPSSDPGEWLRVLCQSSWKQATLRCVPIPRSRSDLLPRGVLFLPNEARPSATATSELDPRLQPFGELAPRFYVPVEAALNAALTPAEYAELHTADDSLLVWLPDQGLMGLAVDEALQVTDLLQVPGFSAGTWTRAEPAEALNTRLYSLRPWEPPTLDDFRQSAQDDIGTQAKKNEDLPPSPREAAPGITAAAARAVAQGLTGSVMAAAGMLDKLKQLFASGEKSPGSSGAVQPQQKSLLERVREWAAATQQRISDSVGAARDREMTRLLEMLQKNPDEGLRYAIPLAGDPSRGVATPGTQLTARDVNYRYGGSGSGPADYWEIAEQNRRALIARYRDLANREIALGRHRRAAYIFAELLGDHAAAAQTLTDGRHYREAALIYEERLKNPRQAAKCLEQGGLLHEAIEIYRELGEHETVGDLYRRLEQQELADAAYEQAISQLSKAGNYLSIAELCQTKLGNLERALDTLEAGWQESSHQRQSCFLRSFELLGQASQHERARRFLKTTLIRAAATSAMVPTFVPDLATVATTYPDANLRDFGKDQARLLIGKSLGANTSRQSWEQQTLLQSLYKLEPGDRLLARDTRRFSSLAARSEQVAAREKRSPPALRSKIQQLHETKLPCDDCRAFVSHGKHFYIAGLRENELILLRGDEQIRIHYPQGKPHRLPAEVVTDFQPRLHWNSAGNGKILLTPFMPRLADRKFPATDQFPEEVTIGAGPMIHGQTVAVSYNGSRAVSCVNVENATTVTLDQHADSGGSLLKSHEVQYEFAISEGYDSFHLHSHFEHWFIGSIDELLIGQGSRSPHVIELPRLIQGFVAAPANSLFRLVTLLEHGIFLTWGYLSNLQHTNAADDLESPVGCFTTQGELILVGKNGIEIYATNQQGLRLLAERKGLVLDPIGVMHLGGTKQFLVVQKNGQALTFSW